ncbi:MAG: hypothetical protein M3R36_16825 [Bacteroidota bacterium]|nr:hypothetical protein [Bacteroidota bacterium]
MNFEQLILMLIDKVAIGVLILVVGFLGQRMLEAYKGRQALWTEISKERVKHIAGEWKEMNRWDSLVGDLFYRLHQILTKQFSQSTDANPKSKTEQPKLADTAEFLSRLEREILQEKLSFICEKELRPYIDESIKQGKVVNASIQENRFWLGKELYDHCEDFRTILNNICVSFDSKEFGELAKQAKDLEKFRQDVVSILKLIK